MILERDTEKLDWPGHCRTSTKDNRIPIKCIDIAGKIMFTHVFGLRWGWGGWGGARDYLNIKS